MSSENHRAGGGVDDAANITPVRLVLKLVGENLVLLLLLMLMFGYHGLTISRGEGAYEMVGRVLKLRRLTQLNA